MNLSPSWKQHLAWQILLDQKTTDFLFGGGAGGGKTWLGCEWLILLCRSYPETRYFIARKTLKNLKRTTLRTFFKVARHHKLIAGVDYIYNEQSAVITFPKTGSTIDLLEVKYNPSDPDYEDLGSAEYTAGWLEEAGEIDFGAYDTLKSRIGRQYNDKYDILGKLYITCNPKKNWLYRTFYIPWKKGNLPKGYQFIQSLVDDNPFNEKNYKANLVNIKDPIKKQRLLFGRWEYDDEPNVLIKYDNIIDLFSNALDFDEFKYLTADIARFGEDKTVVMLWRGYQVVKIWVFAKQSTEITKSKIREIAADEQVPYSHIVIDEDGVGGGVVDGLEGVNGFIANSRAFKLSKDQDINYRNLKTQCAYELARVANNHEMAIGLNIVTELEEITPEKVREYIIQELEQIKEINADADDKPLQITPKDDVKEAIGRSPDFADNLIMRMLITVKDLSQKEPDQQEQAARRLARLKLTANQAK